MGARQIKLGMQYGFFMCCILWFETGYNEMRKKGGLFSGPHGCWEYSSIKDRIMCPSCLVAELYNL